MNREISIVKRRGLCQEILFLWYGKLHFCFLWGSLSSCQSSCVHAQNSCLFLLHSGRICYQSSEHVEVKGTPHITLSFGGKHHSFYPWESQCTSLFSVCDNNANWDLLLKKREENFFAVVESSFLFCHLEMDKNVSFVLPYVTSTRTRRVPFFLPLLLFNLVILKMSSWGCPCLFENF